MSISQKAFIPVMLTPFKDNGAVDFDGLTRLTEWYLAAGATGLFANCLSSEMFELSEQERLDVVRHVVKVAKGHVPVVATGTFGGELQQQADFVKKMYDQGVDAVIGITGLLAAENENEEAFEANLFKLLDLTGDIPMGFYECPVPYKRLISPQLLGKIAATGRVIYHKDTCLDIEQVRQKVAATEAYPFGLYDAYMVHAVESLKAGAAGLSCIQGNFFPELIVWLCQNYNNANLKNQVNEVQQFFIDNMEVMHHVYPIVSKYYLQKAGLDIATYTRRHVGDFDVKVRYAIDALAHRYDLLREQLSLTPAHI